MRIKVVDKFVRIVFVALFLSYYAAFTLFPHTHVTESGSVTHSHPYAPSSNHSHTAASFSLISSLASAVFMASYVGIAIVLFFGKSVVYIACVERILVRFRHYFNLRAPPIY